MPSDIGIPNPCGWIELRGRTKLRLTGADRVRFLHGQVSSDVRALKVGQTQYGCVMTAKGKMCADVFIHAEIDALLLDADESLREELAARLERYIIADDVVLEDVTEQWALFHVVPASEGAAITSRFGHAGEDLFYPMDRRESFRAGQLLPEWTETEIELIRIAAGVPRWGLDLAPDTIPVEAGLEERAISYTKGCYIGQEVISRIKSIGQVQHRLVRLQAGQALVPGEKIFTADGAPTGEVTSAIALPDSRGWIGLGYVRRAQAEAGTAVHSGGGEVRVW